MSNELEPQGKNGWDFLAHIATRNKWLTPVVMAVFLVVAAILLVVSHYNAEPGEYVELFGVEVYKKAGPSSGAISSHTGPAIFEAQWLSNQSKE